MNDNDHRIVFGQKIKRLRNSLGLTQEIFCQMINLEISNLSNIENGKSYPSMSTLIKIIDKFNIEPNEFFDKNPYKDAELVEKLTFEYFSKLPLEKKIMALKIIMLVNEEDKN